MMGEAADPAVPVAGGLRRPLVTWKYGASLDGRVAAADGSSWWVTSAESREDAHRLRAECDAVMVGSGTQRIDDPHLAVRHVEASRQPVRVVVDSEARTPITARVLDDAAPTLIAVADDADAAHLEGRAGVVRVRRGEVGLDLHALLAALHDKDVRSILSKAAPRWPGRSWPPASSTASSATWHRCSSAEVAWRRWAGREPLALKPPCACGSTR